MTVKLLVTAYKNFIIESKETKTMFAIVLLHILFVASFVPMQTIRDTVQATLTSNQTHLDMITLLIFLVLVLPALKLLIDYVYEVDKLLENTVFAEKSIANLFVKSTEKHKDINLLTLFWVISIIEIVVSLSITLAPMSIAIWILTLLLFIAI